MAELNDIQIDALREVGNIGSGNAATALSQMISETVNLSVPIVKVLPLEEVSTALGGAARPVYVVYLKVTRQMNGTMLTIFSPETADFLIGKMAGPEYVNQKEFTESILKEVGSILCGSYLSALAQLVGMSTVATSPVMASDMMGAVMDLVLAEIGQVAEEVMLLETELMIANNRLECSQLFLPDPASLDLILSSLGM